MKPYVILIINLFILALPSCTKDEETIRRSAQPEPDGGLAIIIDTTWDDDTTLYLKP